MNSLSFTIRNLFTFLVITFTLTLGTLSQTPMYYNYNNGASANNFPFGMTTGKEVQSLVLSNEFNQPSTIPSGYNITKVYFRMGAAVTSTFTNLMIKMGQSTITTLPTGVIYTGPLSQVYFRASVSLTSTSGGWMAIQLDSLFAYDTSKSLIIDVSQCGATVGGMTVYNSTLSGFRRTYTTPTSCVFAYAGQDASMVNCGVDVAQAIPQPPVLTSPANGSIGHLLTDTLVWNASAGASSYRVQVATDTGFTNLVVNDSTPTTTSRIVSGLNPLTFYYWRVNAKNGGGTSAYSSKFSFKTMGPASTVTLLTPANNAINQATSLSCYWSTATDLTGAMTVSNYWFELYTDTTQSPVIRDSTLAPASDTTRALSGLLNGQNYWWRVKAKNNIGWGAFTGYFKFTTIVGVPPIPTLLRPVNNAVNIPVTTWLVWNTAAGATSYRVQVSTDSTFTASSALDSTVTLDSLQVPAGKLANNTKYYWHVRASNTGGNSNYSTVFNFTTIVAPPGIPVLLRPPNGSYVGSFPLWLVWSVVSGATSYRVQVATDSTTYATVLFDTTITTDSVSVPASRLLGWSAFYWHVRASNAGGNSNYSYSFVFYSFQDGISQTSCEIPKEFKLYENYPNPFNPSCTIKFDLPKAEAVKLVIYNTIGQVVALPVNSHFGAGTYSVKWDGTNYPSSVYFYRITAGSFSDVKKLVLMK